MTGFWSRWLRLIAICLIACWVITHLWISAVDLDAFAVVFSPICAFAQLQTIPADRRAQYNLAHSGSSRFADKTPENPRKKLQAMLDKSGATHSAGGGCVADTDDDLIKCNQVEENEDDSSSAASSNEGYVNGVMKRKDRTTAMKATVEIEEASSKILKRTQSKPPPQLQQQATPLVSISDVPCQSCASAKHDEPQSLLSLAQHSYWSHNLMMSLGCSCMFMTSQNRLDPYAVALYSSSADALQLMNQFASVMKTSPPAAHTSLRFASWDIVGPFLTEESFFPIDPFISYMRRFASRSEGVALHGWGGEREGSSFDVAAEILRLPMDIRVPSTLSDSGFLTWSRVSAVEPPGVVTTRFPLRVHERIPPSFSSHPNGETELTGWARSFGHVDQGTYVLACSGTSAVHLRSSNTSHRLSLVPYNGTEWSIASIDLKYGPVGIVARLSGTHSLSIGCSLTPSAVFAIVPSIATTVRGPIAPDGSRPFTTLAGAFRSPQEASPRGTKQTGQLLVGDPLHVPDLLLDYDIAAAKGGLDHRECHSGARCHWGYVHKSATNNAGILMSGLFSLPLFSTESRSLSVRIEVESRRLLGKRISVRIPRFRTRRGSYHIAQNVSMEAENIDSEAAFEGLGPAGGDYATSFVVQGGHLSVVPLELFSNDEDYASLTCRPGPDSVYTASITLLVVPERGPRQSVNLVFNCRRLNETIALSYLDIDSSVASVYVIAPVAPVPLADIFLGNQRPPGDSDPDTAPHTPRMSKSAPTAPSSLPMRKSGPPESKRFDHLRNADTSRFDPSAAVKMSGQRVGARPATYLDAQPRMHSSAPLDRNDDISVSSSPDISEGGRQSSPSWTDDVVRSQFYVYKSASPEDRSISVGFLARLEPNSILNGEVGKDISIPVLHTMMKSEYQGFPVIAVFAGPEFSVDRYMTAFSNDGTTMGADGAWVLILKHDPRCLANSARLDVAVDALSSVIWSLPMLPRVDSSSRILVGYGSGAHAALSTALMQPDRSPCFAAIAGALRMEDIRINGVSTRLGTAEPALMEVLARPSREFHALRSIFHGIEISAKLRGVQHESSTHPWFTRNMHIELLASNISSEFDSVTPLSPLSDASPFIFNDKAMKSFYRKCAARVETQSDDRKCGSRILFNVLATYHRESLCGIDVIQQFRTYHTSSVRVDATFYSRFDLIVQATREIDEVRRGRNSSDSFNSFEVSVTDVYYLDSTTETDRVHFDEWLEAQQDGELIDAVGSGEGLEVRQMRRTESLSKMQAHPEMQDLFSLPNSLHGGVLCRIRTSNVRRLRIRTLLEESCRTDALNHDDTIPATLIIVDGFVIHLEEGKAIFDKVTNIELCWGSVDKVWPPNQGRFHGPRLCNPSSTSADLLREKNPSTSASLNHIFSGTAALRIVFGTPTHPHLRSALRETAMALANKLAILARSIQVYSDIEFREYFLDQSEKDIPEALSTHLIFIGDPMSNKVMKDLDDGIGALEARLPLLYPHHSSAHAGAARGAASGRGAGFVVGRYRFDDPDFVAAFTFPVKSRTWSDSLGGHEAATVAACISGNSAASYGHMLELLFAPGSSMSVLLPDFAVVSSDIWGYDISRAIVLAGYWSPVWGFDPKQAYLSPWYRLR